MPCHEVAADVFCATGTDVNWLLVRDGRDVTLIDAGWAGDVRAVERSVRAIGRRPEDVRAILLTHAHLDHVGAANHFHQRWATPLFTSAQEVHHARREYLEQASPVDVAKQVWRPSALAWSVRIVRAGALHDVAVAHAQAFPRSGALDLPGAPVPIATPGHTSGHTAYHLPAAGVVATGDGLVTGHPTSRSTGPQLLPGCFTHAADDAVTALDALAAVAADVVVPGHGVPWHGPVADAVAVACERAARR